MLKYVIYGIAAVNIKKILFAGLKGGEKIKVALCERGLLRDSAREHLMKAYMKAANINSSSFN